MVPEIDFHKTNFIILHSKKNIAKMAFELLELLGDIKMLTLDLLLFVFPYVLVKLSGILWEKINTLKIKAIGI